MNSNKNNFDYLSVMIHSVNILVLIIVLIMLVYVDHLYIDYQSIIEKIGSSIGLSYPQLLSR